jgi:hypothetical protein
MKPGKNIIYKVFVIGMATALIAVTFFCSKKKEEKEQYRVKPRVTKSPEPVIAKVEFKPREPTSLDNVIAVPQLKDPGMTYVKYRYQWFVNEEIIRQNENPLLGKQHYKKGDRVYCRVQALRGNYESKIVKTSEIKIKNTPPTIKYVHPGFVKIPGRFRYTINAGDYDGDSLTYRLVSPLDLGIQLNTETGEILWDIPDIPEPKPTTTRRVSGEGEGGEGEGAIRYQVESERETGKQKRFPSIVKIVFEVRDSDGAAKSANIRLNLSRGRRSPR